MSSDEDTPTNPQHSKAQDSHTLRANVRKNSVTWLIVGAVGLAAISFYSGRAYQKQQTSRTITTANTSNQYPSTMNGGRFGRGMGVGRSVVGAVSSTSIKVTNTQSNVVTTYTINAATTISKDGQTITASDIAVGDVAIVIPSTSDSKVAGQILINPQFGNRFGSPQDDAAPPTNTQ